MSLQIPKNIDSKNIFLLIQELFSKQKRKTQEHDRVLALATINRITELYMQDLDKMAAKSEELKNKLAEEHEELKKSLNSAGGWLLGGMAIAGAVIGLALGGPVLAVAFAGVFAAGGGIAILFDHLAPHEKKSFFESKKEIDPLKLKEKELLILPISDELQAIQIKADMKKAKISEKMQIDVERDQQMQTYLSNMITATLKKYDETRIRAG